MLRTRFMLGAVAMIASVTPSLAQMQAPGVSQIVPPPMATTRTPEALGREPSVTPMAGTEQERRALDNVAERLNQCQRRAEEERRDCMRQAMQR